MTTPVETSLCPTFLEGIALKMQTVQLYMLCKPGKTAHRGRDSTFVVLIYHEFELLHWQDTHRLARRLGFEHARLFREWVHSLTGRRRRLLLELQVQDSPELERTVLFQLIRRDTQQTFNCRLHILRLQTCTLGNRAVRARCTHHAACPM